MSQLFLIYSSGAKILKDLTLAEIIFKFIPEMVELLVRAVRVL